jgi:hypothetical protein
MIKHEFSYNCPLPEVLNLTMSIENTPKGIAINAHFEFKTILDTGVINSYIGGKLYEKSNFFLYRFKYALLHKIQLIRKNL